MSIQHLIPEHKIDNSKPILERYSSASQIEDYSELDEYLGEVKKKKRKIEITAFPLWFLLELVLLTTLNMFGFETVCVGPYCFIAAILITGLITSYRIKNLNKKHGTNV